jgi:hypothetical protein
MKTVFALSFVAALASNAFAQSPNPAALQGFHARTTPPSVALAHKPILVALSRALTADDRNKLFASARLSFSARSLGSQQQQQSSQQSQQQQTPGAGPSYPAATVITVGPGNMASGGVDVISYAAASIDPHGYFLMGAGPSSYLEFDANVAPNTDYVLTVQVVSTYCPGQTPSFTITNGGLANTVALQGNAENGFAFLFDSTQSGVILATVSSNCGWIFSSAELAAAPA